MADEPIKMTRAEYQAKYGAIPTPAVDTTPLPEGTTAITIGSQAPVRMTRAEYASKYGALPGEPNGFKENFIQGAKDLPGALLHSPIDMFNLARDIDAMQKNPIAALQTGTAEKAVRQVGGLSAGIAGAGAGALAGTMFGPGAIVASPLLAALGFGAGTLGFNKLNQLTGSDEPTSAAQDLNQLGYNTGQGLAGDLAVKGISKAMGALSRAAPGMQEGLENSSIGTRKSDFTMSQRRDGLIKYEYVPDGKGGVQKVPLDKPTTRLAQSLDIAKREGVLKIGSSPDKIASGMQVKIDSLGKEVGSVIRYADRLLKKNGTKVNPTFEKAKAYIEQTAEAPLREELRANLQKWENAIKAEGDGSLGFLQQQKIQLGKKTYAAGKEHVQELNAAIVDDMRTAIEKAADSVLDKKSSGRVKSVNKRLSALFDVQPIIDRTLASVEGSNPASFWSNFFKTTGGWVGTGILGNQVGGASGAGLGVASAIAAQALMSPKGKALQSFGINKAGKAASVISDVTSNSSLSPSILGAQSKNVGASRKPEEKENTKPIDQRQQSIERSPSLNSAPISASKQPISYTPKMIKDLIKDEPPIVKAIVKVESNFNHKAKSPKGALGLAQLMPENVKKFGIKDPFDPKESIYGMRTLLSEELDRYKDNPILAIAAYNLGSPKLNKAIERAGSRRWSLVSRYVPTETRDYVRKVLSATRSV